MAIVTTVTPTTTVRDHRPGIADDGDGNVAGELDLATSQAWTYLASFVAGGLDLTYNSGTPSVDIGQGRIARTGDTQQLISVDAESGISLSESSLNYIYFKRDNDYEVRDQDNPPGPDALLVGRIDTSQDLVTAGVRGRDPLRPFVPETVVGGSVTLSSGSVSVDLGVPSSETATFAVYLGPDTDDADVAADIKAVSGDNYTIDIEETDTSVGNPTVEFDITRQR